MISATGRRGMTLAEIMMIAMIMGLIAALCWPSLRAVGRRIIADADTQASMARGSWEKERAVLTGHEK